MPGDANLLGGIPLFQSLSEADRSELVEAMSYFSYPKGQVLFRSGDPGDALYVVRTGRIELSVRDHTGDRIVLEHCEPGMVFGELSLLDGGSRTATAEALDNSELLALSHAELQAFVRKHPEAALNLLAVVATRVRKADEMLRGRVARNVNVEAEQKLSPLDRVADGIAGFAGSMNFVFIHLAFFSAWVVLNLDVIPGLVAFDPFPFGLLTTAVSLEAIFLAVFVLLAQNLQAAKERVRADIEYEINLKAELEVFHLHEKVDRLHEDVLGRLHRIEAQLAGQEAERGRGPRGQG
jgi:uncharacterized membrane protein